MKPSVWRAVLLAPLAPLALIGCTSSTGSHPTATPTSSATGSSTTSVQAVSSGCVVTKAPDANWQAVAVSNGDIMPPLSTAGRVYESSTLSKGCAGGSDKLPCPGPTGWPSNAGRETTALTYGQMGITQVDSARIIGSDGTPALTELRLTVRPDEGQHLVNELKACAPTANTQLVSTSDTQDVVAQVQVLSSQWSSSEATALKEKLLARLDATA